MAPSTDSTDTSSSDDNRIGSSLILQVGDPAPRSRVRILEGYVQSAEAEGVANRKICTREDRKVRGYTRAQNRLAVVFG
jgi:hypothetical protein